MASAQSIPAYKAYFPLNGNVKDSTGNTSGAKRNGTVYASDRNGTANRAMRFDGSKIEYVDLNDSFTFRSSTISVWLNPDKVDAKVNPVILLSNLANISQFTGTGLEIYLYATGKIEVLMGNVSNPPGSLKRFITKSSIPFNKWNHFAITIDSMKTIKLYINCKKDTSYSMAGLPSFKTSKYMMHIGARSYPHYENPYSGSLDELKIFDKVLTENQVTGIYKDFSNVKTITACNSYTYRGKTYTSSGTYNDTLKNIYGCDSVISLKLKINKSNGKTLSIIACDSYEFKGKTVTVSGTYYDTLKNSVGCDSLVTYNIKINKSNGSSIKHVACNSYYFNGNTITANGVYYDTLKNVLNCDSIISLNLTINKSTKGLIFVKSCNTYFFNGSKLTSSGLYYDTLTNAVGCDSFLTLDLIINKSNSSTSSVSACNSYFFNGNIIKTSGIYFDTLKNNVGCDSFLTLKITINKPNVSSFSITSCNSYLFGGNVLTKSGMYHDTLSNTFGCDSVITLNLTINTVNVSVIQSGNILTAIESGAAYQWVDCAKGFSVIPLETKQSFSAISNGNYAVFIIKNNCRDTSSCYSINSIGLPEQIKKSKIQIYPNPNSGIITIDFGEDFQTNKLIITNLTGQKIYENFVNQKLINISLQGESGLYFVSVINANGIRSNIKIVKK